MGNPSTTTTAIHAPRRARRWAHWRAHPAAGAMAALVILVVANAIWTPNFATASNFWNMLWQVSPVLLVATGMTLVIATGGIDLSVGSIMAIAGATAAVQLSHGVIAAIVIALLVAAILGALNGVLVAREGIQPIVVTLATLIAGRGLAQVLSHGGQLIAIDNRTFAVLGPVPIPVMLALAVAAGTAFVLHATPFGRYVVAVGGNRAAARLAGVPVWRTLVLVYVVSGALAGLAGLTDVARVNASDAATVGLNIELDAIAATVVGGTLLVGGRASVFGTVVGALVMQVIATSFNMLLIPYAWSLLFKAVIIVTAVFLQRAARA